MKPQAILLSLGLLWACAAGLAVRPARAEGVAGGPSIEPPRPIDLVAPAFPQDVPGRVVLRLTIDKEGRVTVAEVVEAPRDDLGQHARDAALRSRFEPARKNGAPVAARILQAYEIPLDEPRAPSPPPDPPPAIAPAIVRDAQGAAPRPLPPAPAGPSQAPLEVAVRGPSHADRLRRSAKAVLVIETERARRESADLGEVLRRNQGIGVQQSGGLGSLTRLSLHGLTDDQIRFFLDGVPLELSGFGSGVASVPVHLVDRVEVYRGVVPGRFGADALGGAVNLVTDQDVRGTHASASYQVGSFGTYRLALGARHLHAPTGLFVRGHVFLDRARNDYPIDVEAPDERGRLVPVEVRRFHDAYRALGAGLTVGLVDRPFAKRLLLRVFASGYDKELQHNNVMTVPYGEVTYGERTQGATLRYEQPNILRTQSMPLSLTALAGYSHRSVDFVDLSPWVYDWYGRKIRARSTPGEMSGGPTDRTIWEDSAQSRVEAGLSISPAHTVRLDFAPTYTARTGRDRMNEPESDPSSAARALLRVVTGLEYQMELLDRRLENIAFVKDYVLRATSEEVGVSPGFIEQNAHRFGAGDALRYRLAEGLWAKASYELATRLPRPDEIFGNGVLIVPNLKLEPETSHNANLELMADARDTKAGSFRATVGGFFRRADRLIVLLGNDMTMSYQNVYAARALGIEAAAGWTSPGELFALDANATYQDLRNTSEDGAFRDFTGDRIPNRPYLLANGSARVDVHGLLDSDDMLSLGYQLRYVHSFYRSWESLGQSQSKQVIPSQLVHGAVLTYLVRRGAETVSASVEGQNLTDAKAYDFFGVQRPGRAFFFKGTLEL